MKLSSKAKQAALNRIAEDIQTCRLCRKDKVGLPVSGEGNPDADIVFLGEAPGKREAATGRPFIGPAGKVLRGLIVGIGLKDEDVYITSPVKYLPKHVTPTPEEVSHGRIHLFQQLDIIQPRVVVLLGRVAALAVLQKNIEVAKEHGKTVEQDGRTYFMMYHPAAILYARRLEEVVKKDFSLLKRFLAQPLASRRDVR